MAEVCIRAVAAGCAFGAAVSEEGNFYTWGRANLGQLGHGGDLGCLIPKQVQALAGFRVLAVAAGEGHCLAVTEMGELFSWGWNAFGQCGHGYDDDDDEACQFLLRLVEALACVRVRSASAGFLAQPRRD